MAETYMNVVNQVLDSVGEPLLTQASFAGAAQKQARVKRLVATVYGSQQINLPDEHLRSTGDLLLHAPKDFPGGEDVGITALAAGPPSVVTVAGLANLELPPLGYKALGTVNTASNANVCMKLNTNDDMGDVDHEQWYRIRRELSGTTVQLTTDHLLVSLAGVGLSGYSSPNRIGFTLAHFRVGLPSDFQDFLDIDHPFGPGIDMEVMDTNELSARIYAAGGDYTARHPRYYSITWDTDPEDGSRIGPFLEFFPFPTESRLYRIRYIRKLVAVTEASAYDASIDMPDEMIAALLYECITRAKIDVANQPEGAALYDRLAQRQKKNLEEREMSKAGTPTITPDMGSYRGHFRKRTTGPEIFVEGE